MAYIKNSLCPVCNNNKKLIILKIDQYTLLSCTRCKLLSLIPQQTKEKANYREILQINSYIQYMKPLREKQYDTELKHLSKLTSRKKLLDIGCALGWFINYARRNGYKADGLEPQKDLASQAYKANPESTIYITTLEKIQTTKNYYDIITLWSVFEHFKDPKVALQKIAKLLHKNSLVAIRTPNSLSLTTRIGILLYKLSGRKIQMPLEASFQLEFDSKHWFMFSPDNLSLFLRNHGFNIVTTYYSTSVDWRNIDVWLKSRNITQNPIKIFCMRLFFILNNVFTPFGFGDDFVIVAQKV